MGKHIYSHIALLIKFEIVVFLDRRFTIDVLRNSGLELPVWGFAVGIDCVHDNVFAACAQSVYYFTPWYWLFNQRAGPGLSTGARDPDLQCVHFKRKTHFYKFTIT